MDPRILRFPTSACWLCDLRGWYTCPCCETVSCSLECYIHHKKASDCSGSWVDAPRYSLQELLRFEDELHCKSIRLR